MKLGVHLAFAEPVSVPGGRLEVPVLNENRFFTTLFAPEGREAAALRNPGRAALLYLQ